MQLKRIGSLGGGWFLIIYGALGVVLYSFWWLSPAYAQANEALGMTFERHMSGVAFSMMLLGIGVLLVKGAPRRSAEHWHTLEAEPEWETESKSSSMARFLMVLVGVMCIATAAGLFLGISRPQQVELD